MKKTDAIIGVDRCVLEGIAAKRIAFISSYHGDIALVTKEIIDKEIEENFSGKTLTDNKEEILKYNNDELEDMIRSNYSKIKEKLSISNSIITELEETNINIDPEEFFKGFSKEQETVCTLMENNYNLYQEIIRLKEKLKIFVMIKHIVTLRFIRNKFKRKGND